MLEAWNLVALFRGEGAISECSHCLIGAACNERCGKASDGDNMDARLTCLYGWLAAWASLPCKAGPKACIQLAPIEWGLVECRPRMTGAPIPPRHRVGGHLRVTKNGVHGLVVAHSGGMGWAFGYIVHGTHCHSTFRCRLHDACWCTRIEHSQGEADAVVAGKRHQ